MAEDPINIPPGERNLLEEAMAILMPDGLHGRVNMEAAQSLYEFTDKTRELYDAD